MAFVAGALGFFVPGSTNSMATIAPRPRTSPIIATSCCSERRKGNMVSPSSRARETRFFSRSVLMVASAATAATGLPPYVPPSPPSWTAFISSARPVTPARGIPPARPFAVATMSGMTPS